MIKCTFESRFYQGPWKKRVSFFKNISVRVTPCSQSRKIQAPEEGGKKGTVFCGTLSRGEVVPHPWSKNGRKTRKMVRFGRQAGILSICYCKIDARRSRKVMEPVLRSKNKKIYRKISKTPKTPKIQIFQDFPPHSYPGIRGLYLSLIHISEPTRPY